MPKSKVKVGRHSNRTAVNHVFETKLRLNADKLHNNMDAADSDTRNADQATDILGRVYEDFLTQFASAEGEERWAVRHGLLRGPSAGRDARAVQGASLRSVLRLGRHVRAERRVRRRAWRTDLRHRGLPAEVQLDG